MRSTKSILEALGLCALLIGVMAITANGAQAAGEWDVAGKQLSTYSPALEPEVASTLENKMVTLLGIFNTFTFAKLCTAVAMTGLKLFPGGTSTTGGATFTGCTVWIVEGEEFVEELNCAVHSPGQPNGTIQTEEGHFDLELHEGTTIASVIPNNEEELLETIEFEGCALPEEMPIFGTLVLADCESKAGASQPVHLFASHTLTTLYAINPKHPATLDGSIELFLTGAHTGQSWSASGS